MTHKKIDTKTMLTRPSHQTAPLLSFPEGCLAGRLEKRVKRFSVAFSCKGQTLWAHTNNSGSMLGLLRPGLPVWVSAAPGKERKLPFTLELINLAAGGCPPTTPLDLFHNPSQAPDTGWVGVNTMIPNRLLKAAFYAGRLPFAAGYTDFRPEAKRGMSRLDALLTGPGLPPLWVECKNVTLVEDEVAAFPDAITERGQKHLQEMTDIVRNGERAAFFYCIQRTDAHCFGPAGYVDPTYAKLFYASLAAGVEAYPFTVFATPSGIDLGDLLPLAPPAC